MKKTNGNPLVVTAFVMGAILASMTTAVAAPKMSSKAATEATKVSHAEINVLIDTSSNDYAGIVSSIEGMGGHVTNKFKFVSGLSATIPASALGELSAMQGVDKVTLDSMLYPGPEGGYNIQTKPAGSLPANHSDLDTAAGANQAFMVGDREVQAIPGRELATYHSFQPDSMNTLPIFLNGNTGDGSLVVVIDTGVYADNYMLLGKVVGGVDISTDVGGPYEGATHVNNHFHGTHVGGIIAGFGGILLPPGDPWITSYEYYSGTTLPTWDVDPSFKILPLVGTAPDAELYAVKVFPHTGAGASTSRIIAGIEHAIDMKVNGGIDVDIINMSLGGGTGFEGRDLESQVVDAATAAGITVVVSAGNDGPAPLTIGSPSGANTAITVGNVAHPVNTRFFWDFNYAWVGIGEYLSVAANPQMIYSSSRGATSDGRPKPTASAVGTFVLSASTGSPGALTFASGTSMSSPAMAGVVALLNSQSEADGLGASPYDYKQAVIAGSHPLAGFDAYEQGAGFINAVDAMTAFMADDEYGSAHPALRKGYSNKAKRPEGMQLEYVNEEGGQTIQINDLKPGYVEDYYFKLHPNAERIVVEFSNVDYGFDPLGLNSFEFHLMSGMRSTDSGYYIYTTNVWGDATFSVESMNSEASGYVFGVNTSDLPLMPGYVRMSIENDWTTFDNMSGTVNVRVESGNQSDKADETYSGKLANHESVNFFPVGFGPNGVDFELNWQNDWTSYPASDMDLIIAWFDTNGDLHWVFDAATFNSPELASIDADNIAAVFVLIDAYETYGRTEAWNLEVRHK